MRCSMPLAGPRPMFVGMLVSWVVLLIALVGLVLYLVPTNPGAKEIGRLMFACGLLVLCFALAGKTVRLL
jgi:Na+/phosphate symporter